MKGENEILGTLAARIISLEVVDDMVIAIAPKKQPKHIVTIFLPPRWKRMRAYWLLASTDRRELNGRVSRIARSFGNHQNGRLSRLLRNMQRI